MATDAFQIDGDLFVARPRPAQTEGIETVAVQPLDVLGPVREVVADAPHTAIVGHDAAAIAMNETANELFVMLGHELRLPIGQRDLSFVLSARPVLRKQAGPMIGAHRDDVAAARRGPPVPSALSWPDRLERLPAGSNDFWVCPVEEDLRQYVRAPREI